MGTRETLITPLKSRQRNVALVLTRSALLSKSGGAFTVLTQSVTGM